MNSLTQYLSFGVLFDFTLGVPSLTLTDNSNYPSGVPQLVNGNFTITSPDGLTRTNSLSKPDISWNGTALNTFTIPLRLSCDGTVQQGTYTITYTVTATGYGNSYLTQVFYFNLLAPMPAITYAFDVFTPDLSVSDSTVYSVSGWNYNVSEKLSAQIESLGVNLSTTGKKLSLIYNGNYYDSVYSFVLESTVVYTSIFSPYLSAKFSFTYNYPFDGTVVSANTPPPCYILLNQFSTYQKQQNENACGCPNNLNEVSSLLNFITASLASKTYEGLYESVILYENIVTNGTYNYDNTGIPISPYEYNCGSSSSGGGGGGINAINPVPISFIVGDSGYAIAGQSSVTIPSLSTGTTNPKQIIIFQKGGTPVIPVSGYNFTPSTGTIQLLGGDQFNNGEQVYIFAYYTS